MLAGCANSTLAKFEKHIKYQSALLAAITLMGAALRFYKLGVWSFWIDEIFAVGHVQAHFGSFDAIIHNIPPARNWVPLSLLFTGGVLSAFDVSSGVQGWSPPSLASPLQQLGFFLFRAPYLAVRAILHEGRKGNLSALRGLFRGILDLSEPSGRVKG